MESKKKNGSDEPRSRTRNKDIDVENGLDTGGGKVSWDEVRE